MRGADVSGGTVWAPLRNHAHLYTLPSRTVAFAHTHQAMVLAAASAAGGHTRIRPRSKSKQRREKGQCKNCQQHNGERSTQHPD